MLWVVLAVIKVCFITYIKKSMDHSNSELVVENASGTIGKQTASNFKTYAGSTKQDIIDSSNSVNVGTGLVNNTEFNRLNGITSVILETNNKNTANGVAGLDNNGLISTSILPSSVDEIIEVTNFGSLPRSGEGSKIYVTLNDHKVYRWGDLLT